MVFMERGTNPLFCPVSDPLFGLPQSRPVWQHHPDLERLHEPPADTAMKTLPRFLALLATLLAAVPAARAQSPAAKAPANPPTAGTPKAADLPGFALIPGGEFTMGDALDGDKNAPQHTVNVSAFYMAKTR